MNTEKDLSFKTEYDYLLKSSKLHAALMLYFHGMRNEKYPMSAFFLMSGLSLRLFSMLLHESQIKTIKEFTTSYP